MTFAQPSLAQIRGMVGDVRELPSDDLVALEFAARALQEPIDRLGGFGAVELDFPGSCSARGSFR